MKKETNHEAKESDGKQIGATILTVENMGQKVLEYEAIQTRKLDPWSKEGVIKQFKRSLLEEPGPSLPPHLFPYKAQGTCFLCWIMGMLSLKCFKFSTLQDTIRFQF